jgi:hypothetical protein
MRSRGGLWTTVPSPQRGFTRYPLGDRRVLLIVTANGNEGAQRSKEDMSRHYTTPLPRNMSY